MKLNNIVATIKPWNIKEYYINVENLEGNWHLVTTPEELETLLDKIVPEFIFFPHWSWIVPEKFINKFNCVCFHMTDVPYGRGGSPLQNLISRGHKETKLSALKMVKELDAGPVYIKTDLSLLGSCSEIFSRAAKKVYELIQYILEHQPEPVPQKGNVVLFKRRTPQQSVLPVSGVIETLYDHIRMLDAETYPKAFIDYGEFRMIFENAVIKDNGLETTVTITRKDIQ